MSTTLAFSITETDAVTGEVLYVRPFSLGINAPGDRQLFRFAIEQALNTVAPKVRKPRQPAVAAPEAPASDE